MEGSCRMSEHGEHTQSHIDLIAKQEHEFLSKRSISEWIGDRVASFAGSIYFVLLHAVVVMFWVLINAGWITGIAKFDPYPYSLLGTVVAIEAVFLASFILMRQTRMTRRAERRDHLNLQIDLISEKEITKVLQLTRAICTHMGLKRVADDAELKELSRETSVETLSQRLEDTLPEA
jgi:uncharacterized membrane protein